MIDIEQAKIVRDILQNIPSDPVEYYQVVEKLRLARSDAEGMFFGMLDELESSRKRIAELESPPEHPDWCNDYRKYQLGKLSEDAIKWMLAYRKAQNSNVVRRQQNERLLSGTTIPQAGDADTLKAILDHIELLREGIEGPLIDEEVLCNWRKVLKGYLAAIEGPCQKE
jgi:hypothetical protein